MTITTRLEVKYIRALIQILTVDFAFIRILENFGERLLRNGRLGHEIKEHPINRKINIILKRFCETFQHEATYERIIDTLKQCQGDLSDLQEKVKREANSKRAKVYTNQTKIEEKNIPEIMKILLKDCNFASNLDTFAELLGMEEASTPLKPKTYFNSILYNFCRKFPQKAVFEHLIDILENKMGFPDLANSIQTKFLSETKIINTGNRAQSVIIKKETEKFVRPEISHARTQTIESTRDHEEIKINHGDKRMSYKTILKKYFDENVTVVVLQDPYLKEEHQIVNFYQFLRMLSSVCSNVLLKIVTTDITAIEKFCNTDEMGKEIYQTCCTLNIEIKLETKSTIHDRWLWICRQNLNFVKISLGRGLDWFSSKKVLNKLYDDQDKWICKDTSLIVLHGDSTLDRNMPSTSSGISLSPATSNTPSPKTKRGRVRSKSQKK